MIFRWTCAWSPAGNALAVAGGEGRLYRIAPEGGEPVLLGTHEPGLLSVAWQPKGELLATAGQDGSVRLWKARRWRDAGGASRARLARRPRVAQRRAAARLRRRPDAAWYSTPTASRNCVLDAHTVNLTHLAWRGRDEIVAAGNGALFVDRIAGGGQVEQFLLEGTPQTLALSPDLKIVANGLADGTVNFRYLNEPQALAHEWLRGQGRPDGLEREQPAAGHVFERCRQHRRVGFQRQGTRGQRSRCSSRRTRNALKAWPGSRAARYWSPPRATGSWCCGSRGRVRVGRWTCSGCRAPPALARWSPDGKRLAVAESGGRISCYALRA